MSQQTPASFSEGTEQTDSIAKSPSKPSGIGPDGGSRDAPGGMNLAPEAPEKCPTLFGDEARRVVSWNDSEAGSLLGENAQDRVGILGHDRARCNLGYEEDDSTPGGLPSTLAMLKDEESSAKKDFSANESPTQFPPVEVQPLKDESTASGEQLLPVSAEKVSSAVSATLQTSLMPVMTEIGHFQEKNDVPAKKSCAQLHSFVSESPELLARSETLCEAQNVAHEFQNTSSMEVESYMPSFTSSQSFSVLGTAGSQPEGFLSPAGLSSDDPTILDELGPPGYSSRVPAECRREVNFVLHHQGQYCSTNPGNDLFPVRGLDLLQSTEAVSTLASGYDLVASESQSVHDISTMEMSPELSEAYNLSIYSNSVAVQIPFCVTGLDNLGNTCFMNSALQCLVHTPHLVRYFFSNYVREINHHNSLGTKGDLAVSFGTLLRELWISPEKSIAPISFTTKLASFAPQFSDYSQQDSHELLIFLLDGLHEDLNRETNRIYVELQDSNGRPDQEVAFEYWNNHVSRNDSVIVDVFHGQYKSTVVCPICRKVSVTFDPFMYLSLPVPEIDARAMTVTVYSGDGSVTPISYTVTVSKQGRCQDLVDAIRIACGLDSGESLLLAEIYEHQIFRILDQPQEILTAIKDEDRLAAYRLPNLSAQRPLLVLYHYQPEVEELSSQRWSQWKPFASPHITCLPKDFFTGKEFVETVHELLRPMKWIELQVLADAMKTGENEAGTSNVPQGKDYHEMLDSGNNEDEVCSGQDSNSSQPKCSMSTLKYNPHFQLNVTNKAGNLRGKAIGITTPLFSASKSASFYNMLFVKVSWSAFALKKEYEAMEKMAMPPKVTKASEKVVSLHDCLESFVKEDLVGPEDLWYCSNCREHRRASKNIDLWRLPEVLIVHLKRFSYFPQLGKIETFVDFPVCHLDLSRYVPSTSQIHGYDYELYAISNHYGSLSYGHYDTFARLDEEKWYSFDDSNVSQLSGQRIKTSAAYVLFYRRV